MSDCEPELGVGGEQETWDDWVDEGGDAVVFSCVFCDVGRFPSEEPLHAHHEATHGFSLTREIAARRLDTYGTIQLVNFLRASHAKGVSAAEVIAQLAAKGEAAFRHDEFLQPVVADDPLLYCLDCADSDESDDDDEGGDGGAALLQQHQQQKEEHEEKTATSASGDAATAEERLQRENDALKLQLAKYARLMRDFVDEGEGEGERSAKTEDRDAYYFDSYSHVGIHREMITDRIRTDGYRNAILNNPELFKGKVVLDVGCGTGILSMFAAQAGAARVFAVDYSEMGHVAREITQANGFGDVITVFKGKMEDLVLPVDKVDVIISEWMGYCLLYESMLDTVLVARDRWLAPGGHLFPDKCSMFIQGAFDSQQRIAFWDDVYGFDMKAIKSKISIRDAFVENVPAKDILTDRALLKEIDIDHVTYDELDFRSSFTLTASCAGVLHGFVTSFDIGFERDCTKPEYFTTGVEGKPTHWQQVFFHVETPFSVAKDEQLQGKWWVRRNAENPRFLDVELEWKRSEDESFTQQRFRIHN